jgi:hypothetical protein
MSGKAKAGKKFAGGRQAKKAKAKAPLQGIPRSLKKCPACCELVPRRLRTCTCGHDFGESNAASLRDNRTGTLFYLAAKTGLGSVRAHAGNPGDDDKFEDLLVLRRLRHVDGKIASYTVCASIQDSGGQRFMKDSTVKLIKIHQRQRAHLEPAIDTGFWPQRGRMDPDVADWLSLVIDEGDSPIEAMRKTVEAFDKMDPASRKKRAPPAPTAMVVPTGATIAASAPRPSTIEPPMPPPPAPVPMPAVTAAESRKRAREATKDDAADLPGRRSTRRRKVEVVTAI